MEVVNHDTAAILDWAEGFFGRRRRSTAGMMGCRRKGHCMKVGQPNKLIFPLITIWQATFGLALPPPSALTCQGFLASQSAASYGSALARQRSIASGYIK